MLPKRSNSGLRPRTLNSELAQSQINRFDRPQDAVGADVAAMSYTSASKEKVIAGVAKGQFAIWLPGNELQNASDKGARVEVTYRDGATEMRLLSF